MERFLHFFYLKMASHPFRKGLFSFKKMPREEFFIIVEAHYQWSVDDGSVFEGQFMVRALFHHLVASA